jgi:hypothetical protein
MRPDRKIEADKIHILSINTIEGKIDCGEHSDVQKVAGHQFSYKLNNAVLSKENIVGFKLVVDIVAIDRKKKELAINGSYTHEMLFRIDNLEDFIEKTDEGELLDAALGSTLVSIIYSTVRGLIYSRTQSTSLGVVTLPVIAPLKLMGIESLDEVKSKDEVSKKEKKKVAH